MKKITNRSLIIFFFFVSLISCKHQSNKGFEQNENEEYDGIREVMEQEFEMTKDPALGRVPTERLWDAINYTEALRKSNNYRSLSVLWQERGPVFDSTGLSNGNTRGGKAYASGRINGFLVDAADATGNTVFTGGACGGIWKCTNFLSTTTAPNWVAVNDVMSNMSIVSFAQDPTNLDIMYCATGEPWTNIDAVRGNGVYKSVDHGLTWSQLPSTLGITRSFKIICDASGNVFYATGGSGLLRSMDKGATWTTITPSSVSSVNCTDIELSSTGVLHASFGFLGSTVFHRFTNSLTTVTPTAKWSTSAGIRISSTAAIRLELATLADTVYAVTCNSVGNVDSCYKSVDGGATFTKMNTSALPNIANTQGWYDLTLAINPNNSHEIICGGLDAYKSSNDGQTFSRLTYWVISSPYVHADHHFMQWVKVNETQNKIIIASDGGLFYSLDGATFKDKNKNLAIKQFYSCAIHPNNTNYILGGAQDNGSHQFKNAGLSYSIEVTGGDGAFVDIDQNEPQYQFTSYVYNIYHRSTNGGANWASFDFASTAGSFINPYDYDDEQNIMLCAYNSNTFLRWNDPQTASSAATASTSTITLTELGNKVSTIQVSPYTTGRAFFGSASGKIVRVDNTKTTTGTGSGDVTTLTAPGTSNVSCIAIGTNDNNLLAIYSNYGINNIYYSSNGGTTWTAIDGNLPDMPVRWAVFHPTDNTKAIIATEAGVFTTGLINGASTQWAPSPGFPLVRTDMLKLRKSDNTLVAATHGRGMWSGNMLDILPIRKISLSASLSSNNQTSLVWNVMGASNQVKYFVQYSEDGIHFNQIADLPSISYNYKHTLSGVGGYYRIMSAEPNIAPVFSNIVCVKTNRIVKGLQIKVTPNPIFTKGNITISSNLSGNYNWQLCNIQGNVLQKGNGMIQAGAVVTQPIDVSRLSVGMYVIQVLQGNEKQMNTFVKQ